MPAIERRRDAAGRLRYRVKIRLAGHPSISRTFDRLEAARRWAQRTEADLRAGL